jgi:hypothetical protein
MYKYLLDKIKTLIEINYNSMKYIELINECGKVLIIEPKIRNQIIWWFR